MQKNVWIDGTIEELRGKFEDLIYDDCSGFPIE